MNKKPPLVADKELYRLWYEFYKLALNSTNKDVQKALKKSRSFYADWEVIETERFDPWWAKHRELFEQRNFVSLVSDPSHVSRDSLLIEIPKTKTKAAAIEEIRELLDRHLPKKRRNVITESKYVPTEIQGVKREALRMMLDLERHVFRKTALRGWDLFERVQKFFASERFKRKKNYVPQSFFVDRKINEGDNHENAERNMRRYRQKVQKLILNVASGEFPGKY